MPDIASKNVEREEPPEVLGGFASLLYFFFGGEFFGLALWVVGNLVSGFLTSLLYLLGGVALLSTLRRRLAVVSAFVLALLAGPVFLLISTLIAMLASGGAYGTDTSSGPDALASAISAAILWLALGVPRRGFVMGLDRGGKGHARAFVIRVCTVLSSALTGAYVLLLHHGGGPLSSVDVDALVVGTVFTVFLVAPGYSYVATRCWELGLRRMFWFSPQGRSARHAALREMGAAQMQHASRQEAAQRQEQAGGARAGAPDTHSTAAQEREAGQLKPTTTAATLAKRTTASAANRKPTPATPKGTTAATSGKRTTAPEADAEGISGQPQPPHGELRRKRKQRRS